jgi:hypothetical protein
LVLAEDAETCLRRAPSDGLEPLQRLLMQAICQRAHARMERAGLRPNPENPRFNVLQYFGDKMSIHADWTYCCDVSGLLRATPAVAQWVLARRVGLGFMMRSSDVLFGYSFYCELEPILQRLARMEGEPTSAHIEAAYREACAVMDGDLDEEGPYLIGIGRLEEFTALCHAALGTLRAWHRLPYRGSPKRRPAAQHRTDERWLAVGDVLVRAHRQGLNRLVQQCEQEEEYPIEYGTVLTLTDDDADFFNHCIQYIDAQNGEPMGTNYALCEDVPLESAYLSGCLTVSIADLLHSTSEACKS